MRTTLDLPDPLFHAIEVRAAERGLPVAATMRELLEDGLAAKGAADGGLQRPVVTTDPKTGLPRVECKAAALGHELTPERVAEILLDQEAAWHQAASRHEAGR